MTRTEAAAIAGLCERTISRAIAAGKIPTRTLLNRLVIRRADLDQFLVDLATVRPSFGRTFAETA